MGNAGLLLIGPVLLLNGLVILGVVPERSAALLNIFVGGIQVILPTIILAQNPGDPAIINGTWPTYLFAFTYLYYGLGVYLNLEPQGLGWFSSVVVAVALYKSATSVSADPVFAVIWLAWAGMWLLFFLLMALGRERLSRFTGWFLVLLALPTTTIPAVAGLEGRWPTSATAGLLALGALIAATALSAGLARGRSGEGTPAGAITQADGDVTGPGDSARRSEEPALV